MMPKGVSLSAVQNIMTGSRSKPHNCSDQLLWSEILRMRTFTVFFIKILPGQVLRISSIKLVLTAKFHFFCSSDVYGNLEDACGIASKSNCLFNLHPFR